MRKIDEQLQLQAEKLFKTGALYRSSISGQSLWNLYLASFTKEANPTFRDPNASVHSCNLCNNFIRRYGNIVAIKGNKIITLFDSKPEDEDYVASFKAMSKALKAAVVENVFFETYSELNMLNYEKCSKTATVFQLGIPANYKKYTAEEVAAFPGTVNSKDIYTFNHFSLKLPKAFVDQTGASVETIMASYRDKRQVFKRMLDEIPKDTLLLVKDLIVQKSLLNSEKYIPLIEEYVKLLKDYSKVPEDEKEAWAWTASYGLSEAVAKFGGTVIGQLFKDLSQGKELNYTVREFNKRVDPVNYMKAASPITAAQIKAAEKFVVENGYVESFDRRLATISDIKASEIMHMNSGSPIMVDGNVLFHKVKASVPTRHKLSEFKDIEEVGIEKFMKDILPSATSLEAFFTAKHEKNMAVITTAKNIESKPIFQWPNNYSWTYNGNLAGKSEIKEAVKSQGGNTDALLRFSIMWSEGDSIDDSDLDAHCQEPGNHIYFGNRQSRSGGFLDIDIQYPVAHKRGGKKVVENIAYSKNSLNSMPVGIYRFQVNQYSGRNSGGFKAEIEVNDELFSYEYNVAVRGYVDVASVTKHADGRFTIEHILPVANSLTKVTEVYGLKTGQFHKVELACLSPNYWGDSAVGNKHYFFMLEGAKASERVRTFHNENLNGELQQHRKVLDVLGETTAITPSGEKHLAGLGFNATVNDELIVKVSGSFKRTLKIKF